MDLQILFLYTEGTFLHSNLSACDQISIDTNSFYIMNFP